MTDDFKKLRDEAASNYVWNEKNGEVPFNAEERSGFKSGADWCYPLAYEEGRKDVGAELKAEVERLGKCLKTANSNHEHFERLFYLKQDELEAEREARADGGPESASLYTRSPRSS